MPLVPDPQHPGAFRVVFGETSQSWVDPVRPDLLLFEYVVQVSLLFEHGLADVGQGERIRVIHIGGAGLSIPRWIAWRRPSTSRTLMPLRGGRGRRMVICNVTDSSPFGWTRRFAAGLAERWRHLLVGTEPAVWKGRRFGNLLLAASGTRVDVTGLRRDSAKQPCPYRWIEGRELRSWIGGAEPFTDADTQDSPPPSGSKLWFS